MRGKEILFVRAQKSTLVSREKENEVLWAEEMYFVFGPCRPEGEFYLSVISLSFVIMFSSVQLERLVSLVRYSGRSSRDKVESYLLARATSHCRTASRFVSSFALMP